MKQIIDENIYLEGDRIYLRYLKKEDALDVYDNIMHNKNVLKYYIAEYADNRDTFTIDKLIENSKKVNYYILGIVLKSTNEVIGIINQCSIPGSCFNSSEVGYALGEKYWGNGYAAEALKLFMDYLFSTGIHKVYAKHMVENLASGRVMQKCGMLYEGKQIDDLYYQNKYHDCECYYLINPYEKSHQ